MSLIKALALVGFFFILLAILGLVIIACTISIPIWIGLLFLIGAILMFVILAIILAALLTLLCPKSRKRGDALDNYYLNFPSRGSM